MRTTMDVHTTLPDGTKRVDRSVDHRVAYFYKCVFEKKESPILTVDRGVITRISSIYIEDYVNERGDERQKCHVTLSQSVPGAKSRVRIRRDDAV